MKKDIIGKNITLLESRLYAGDTGIFEEFPIATYVDCIKLIPATAGYHYMPNDLILLFDQLKSKHGQTAMANYHKLALCQIMQASLDTLELAPFTPSVLELYHKWYARVLEDFDTKPDDFYDHNNDLFIKDLCICSLRMFPAGAEVVEVSGMSRKYITSSGIAQMFKAMLFYVLKMKGHTPYYQIHLDIRCIRDFNPEGWEKCYIRIADMLKENPNVKGVFGSSWFFDPHLKDISPRLVYLRTMPEHNGAKVFRVGSSDSDIKSATVKSNTRKSLYEEGKYTPTCYILIWPRKELINWAERKRNSYGKLC